MIEGSQQFEFNQYPSLILRDPLVICFFHILMVFYTELKENKRRKFNLQFSYDPIDSFINKAISSFFMEALAKVVVP